MKKWIIVTSILCGLSLISCGPYKAEKHTTPLQESERVILLDLALTRYLNVVKHKANKLPGGQLEVVLEIENEENKDIWTDVQVIFRDSDGFEVDKTNWEPWQWRGHMVTTLRKNSLNAKASDYRILIRNTK